MSYLDPEPDPFLHHRHIFRPDRCQPLRRSVFRDSLVCQHVFKSLEEEVVDGFQRAGLGAGDQLARRREHLLHELADRGISLQDPGLNRLDALVQLHYPLLCGDPLLPERLEEVGLLLGDCARVAVDQPRRGLRFTEDRRGDILRGVGDSEVSCDTIEVSHLDNLGQVLDELLVLSRNLRQEPHLLARVLPVDDQSLRCFDPHYNRRSVRVGTNIDFLLRVPDKSKCPSGDLVHSLEHANCLPSLAYW